MGIDSELTAEDVAAFKEMGVTLDVTPEPTTPPADEPPAPASADEPPAPSALDPNRHLDRVPGSPERGPDGKFKAAEPADPNAPPADPNAPPADDKQKMVPHQALHAERQKAAQLVQQNALLMSRVNKLLQRDAANEPAPLPNLDEDPVGYLTEIGKRITEIHSSQQQNTYEEQLDTALQQDEALFTSYTPDYDAASEHYAISRVKALATMGIPQEQIRDILVRESRQIARTAWEGGKSAAQVIYALAQAHGYSPAAPGAETPAPAPAAVPGSQTPAPAPAQPPVPAITPASVVAAVREGQAAATSLGGATGGAAPAQLTAEAILAMSEEEFEAHMALGSKGANERFMAVAGR